MLNKDIFELFQIIDSSRARSVHVDERVKVVFLLFTPSDTDPIRRRLLPATFCIFHMSSVGTEAL